MYRYDLTDKTLVKERVAQFRDQTRRFLAGELSEDEFRPLRLRNGLYLQRHAPMLRIAIPYGLLSAAQLRTLGAIAQRYDRGYGHFTTRQNLQLNWPTLESVPEILDGGAILTLLIETVMGRDLSLNVKEAMLKVGFVFLMVVVAFVLYNDITKILPAG